MMLRCVAMSESCWQIDDEGSFIRNHDEQRKRASLKILAAQRSNTKHNFPTMLSLL
jgi:hypothetical protein